MLNKLRLSYLAALLPVINIDLTNSRHYCVMSMDANKFISECFHQFTAANLEGRAVDKIFNQPLTDSYR